MRAPPARGARAAYCCCACAAAAAPAAAGGGVAPESAADVLIVGAGMAGMAAAAALHRAGVQDFVVVEATGRTGGRVEAYEFGDPSVRRVVLERGANWVSGAPRKGPLGNPLYRLARDHGLRMTRVPGSAANMTNWASLDARGRDADPDGARRREVNRVADCVNRTADSAERDMSVYDAMKLCGWDNAKRDDMDRGLMWQPFTGESGLPPERMSLWGTYPDPTYAFFGPDDWFVTDQSLRGFAQMVDAEAAGAVEPGDPRVVLNASVARLTTSCGGVEAALADGRRFRAKYAISTLPVGVLQRHEEALFRPRLPRAQREALADYSMCNYTKMVAQWRTPFWDNSVQKWAWENKGSNGGELPSWRNLNHASTLPGSNTLFWDLGDPQSSRWEAMTDAEAQAELMRIIRSTYGPAVPDPVAFHITRHGRDPMTYGAYSGWGTAMTEAKFDTMTAAAPAPRRCAPRVFLGGEGMCGNFNGFVHGALLSGRKAAAQVRHAMGVAPLPPGGFECDWQSRRLRRPSRPRRPDGPW